MNMTFNSRYYLYGVLKDGSKEFIHSFLNHNQAIVYAGKHKALFPNRYTDYLVGDAQTFLDSLKVS